MACLEGLWRKGAESRRHVEQHLRTACDLLLDHTMLLQGHSTQAYQLPNLFTLEFQNEGVTPRWPVIMVMDQGKTNQFGKREYAACIRNREVVACPVGALAFYLFYRWHRGGLQGVSGAQCGLRHDRVGRCRKLKSEGTSASLYMAKCRAGR